MIKPTKYDEMNKAKIVYTVDRPLEEKINHKKKRYAGMNSIIHIIIIFMVAFVSSANVAFTCGNYSEKTNLEHKAVTQNKSCCSDQKTCRQNHSDGQNDCGGGCDSSSCYCAHAVSAACLKDVDFGRLYNLPIPKKLWNFHQNLPKPVYLAIWAPPKIG